VLALQALLHDARGEQPAARSALERAVNLARLGGFIRLFLDLGPGMEGLLKRLIRRNINVDYVGKILAAFRDEKQVVVPDASDQDIPSPSPLIEPLTNRELEVLSLLEQRLRNKEIAEKLFISPETVKRHTINIYQKLSVNSRREAVAKAEGLGIL